MIKYFKNTKNLLYYKEKEKRKKEDIQKYTFILRIFYQDEITYFSKKTSS